MAYAADFSNVDDLQWLAVSLVDGHVIAELPDLQVNKMSYRMEEMTSTTGELPWENIPDNWRDATKPYAVAILLVQYPIVVWGGMVVKRERKLGAAAITLTLATIEHLLDSSYIIGAQFVNTQQTRIMEKLISNTFDANHNFNYRLDVSDSATVRDRTYTDDQDKTVLSAIQELSSVIGGCEFTSHWEMNDNGTYIPVIKIADRVGSVESVTDFVVDVMDEFTVLEDYSTEFGANRVKAVSTANGDVRPESQWYTEDPGDRPVIEYKFTPGTSITEISTLDQYAQQKIGAIKNGTTTITVVLDFLTAPKVGLDWELGDVVTYDVSQASKQFPDIHTMEARIIGYDVSFSGSWTLTPVLQEDS